MDIQFLVERLEALAVNARKLPMTSQIILEQAAVLVSDDAGDSERLQAMVEKTDGKPLDGFALAQRDLEIRGAGEFLGDEQSGVDELRIVDLKDVDPRLARETAEDADAVLARDPTLERPEHAGLAVAVEALWRRYALA